LLQSKDKKISTEPEKNMPKSFESQCFLLYFALYKLFNFQFL